MNGYDGPTLRSLRETQNVPLRRVARQAGMSHGHLSKVERGEPGRPVTPAVLAAYEKSTGIRLTGVAGHGPDDPTSGGTWRRGHLSEARRRTLNAKIAAVAVGGPLGEQLGRILDSTGRVMPPDRVEPADVRQLEAAARLCTELDLQCGGAVCDQMAKALLRWAIGLLDTAIAEGVEDRLYAALGALAQRAGWAAFDADSHDVARSLLTVALYAASRADEPDLRAHVLADLAAQHNYLGYPDDCLRVVRLGEIDERVNPAVRMVLFGVKARAYAVSGEVDACLRHIALAEQEQAAASATEGWLATIGTPGHLFATTGHAAATLGRRANLASTLADAKQRLTGAIDEFDREEQARASALCKAQLATLHLEAGELREGSYWGRMVLADAGIRSHRLSEHLVAMRIAAGAHSADPAVGELVAELETIQEH